MTSSPDSRALAPRRHRAGRLRRAVVIGIAVAMAAVAITGWAILRPASVDPAAAGRETARSVAALAAGDASTARDAATAAVHAQPGATDAQLALARALLALGDGPGADGVLQRAAETGAPPRMLALARAEALILERQPDRALAQLDLANNAASDADRAAALRLRGRALALRGDAAGALAAFDAAAARAPRDAALWVAIGRFKADLGDVLGAIQASERAVALAPQGIEPLALRADMVRTQFGPVASLPWWEAALARDPRRHDLLVEYAATLGDVGRSVDALAVTRRALAVRPDSAQALYLQAVIAARGGNPALARTLLGRTGGGVDGVPGAMLLAATLDLQRGAYEQAADRLGALVDRQPMNIAARELLAQALLRSDAARNAIDTLRPVVARPDASPYALLLVARGLERIGERATAARLIDRAARPGPAAAPAFRADDGVPALAAAAAAHPGDPEAAVPLVRALLDAGDRAGALARAQAIAARNPGAPGAHQLLGDTLMLLGRAADAVPAYRRAADLRFDEPAMLRLVEALDATGQRQPAAQVLALFLSQNPVNVTALRLAGQWQLAAGDFAAAIDTFELLRARIGDGDALVNAALATAYAEIGDADTAAEFGEAAYALAPANPAVDDAYGWALFRGGDVAGATELLEKAVSIDPRHAGLQWHLAQIHAAAGRRDAARAEASAALATPGFADRVAAAALVAANR